MDRMDRWGRVLWWWLRIGGQVSVGCPVRVAGRGPEGVWLWLAAGSPGWRARLPGGRRAHLRDLDPERWPPGGFPLRPDRWRNGSALILQPPGAGYAVWWFFSRDGTFGGWYVNFERRTRYDEQGAVNEEGTDIVVGDLELDLTVSPDRHWRWKDEESFAVRTGHPRFWTAEEAETVRADGLRLAALAEAGTFPFDGTACDFAPPTDWGTALRRRPPGPWLTDGAPA
ncbi:DUF402 domain-containing protein [Streptomyces albidoflavus]|uniref:DUF402 domain-containing protein n=1 Tax=Streptomyces albidoflavus TaxID=1886 RepID=UPI00101E417A|nr:DUF402 domain-containing protein [Streptomyces albidoflavus]RZE66833.1 DUF402 domain-containing protein [Streptomyces albidoflavus]RZE81322.1 DUF402 domain-containing protein [Streptomyces albidoflavus]